ncbi:MAG: hypothetical protein WDW36_008041 [Sanguina aurantia]
MINQHHARIPGSVTKYVCVLQKDGSWACKAAASDLPGPSEEPEPQPVPVPPLAEPKTYLGYEALTWAKIIPLASMFFCILFNYTILRDTKDVLVVTAPGSGAEIIPFLKTWVNLPMAVAFTVAYSEMANRLSPEQLFYACITPFIIFFGLFATFIYPARHTLHPTEWCKELLGTMGPRFAGPISILRNWTFCLFYVMAELWGSVVVSVLFWGFANQVTTVEEASQFYPLFGLGANIALIFSGQTTKHFSLVGDRSAKSVGGPVRRVTRCVGVAGGDFLKARRNLIIVGMLGAFVFLLPVVLTHDLVTVAISLSLACFFAELVVAPIWAVPMDIAPRYAGAASGMMNFGFGLAGIVSPLLFGAALDATGSWTVPFGASLALLLVGAALTFFMRPDRPFVE